MEFIRALSAHRDLYVRFPEDRKAADLYGAFIASRLPASALWEESSLADLVAYPAIKQLSAIQAAEQHRDLIACNALRTLITLVGHIRRDKDDKEQDSHPFIEQVHESILLPLIFSLLDNNKDHQIQESSDLRHPKPSEELKTSIVLFTSLLVRSTSSVVWRRTTLAEDRRAGLCYVVSALLQMVAHEGSHPLREDSIGLLREMVVKWTDPNGQDADQESHHQGRDLVAFVLPQVSSRLGSLLRGDVTQFRKSLVQSALELLVLMVSAVMRDLRGGRITTTDLSGPSSSSSSLLAVRNESWLAESAPKISKILTEVVENLSRDPDERLRRKVLELLVGLLEDCEAKFLVHIHKLVRSTAMELLTDSSPAVAELAAASLDKIFTEDFGHDCLVDDFLALLEDVPSSLETDQMDRGRDHGRGREDKYRLLFRLKGYFQILAARGQLIPLLRIVRIRKKVLLSLVQMCSVEYVPPPSDSGPPPPPPPHRLETISLLDRSIQSITASDRSEVISLKYFRGPEQTHQVLTPFLEDLGRLITNQEEDLFVGCSELFKDHLRLTGYEPAAIYLTSRLLIVSGDPSHQERPLIKRSTILFAADLMREFQASDIWNAADLDISAAPPRKQSRVITTVIAMISSMAAYGRLLLKTIQESNNSDSDDAERALAAHLHQSLVPLLGKCANHHSAVAQAALGALGRLASDYCATYDDDEAANTSHGPLQMMAVFTSRHIGQITSCLRISLKSADHLQREAASRVIGICAALCGGHGSHEAKKMVFNSLQDVSRDLLSLLDSSPSLDDQTLLVYLQVLLAISRFVLVTFYGPAEEEEDHSGQNPQAVTEGGGGGSGSPSRTHFERAQELIEATLEELKPLDLNDFEDKDLDENQAEATNDKSTEESTSGSGEDIVGGRSRAPPHVRLTELILQRSIHFLSLGGSDPHLQRLVTDTLDLNIRVLSYHEDNLLPMAHLLWPNLLRTFGKNIHSSPGSGRNRGRGGGHGDGDLLSSCRALALIDRLCGSCGDFLAGRVLKDLVPLCVSFLAAQSAASASWTVAYKLTAVFSLQRELVDRLGPLVRSVKIHGHRGLWPLSEALMAYLSRRQPRELQEAALRYLTLLGEEEADHVWGLVQKWRRLDNYAINLKRLERNILKL